MSRRQRVALSLSLGLVLACGRGDTPKSGAAEAAAKADSGDAATGGADKAVVDEAAAEEARKRELQHSVVFADRINYPYVLLLPDGSKDAPPTPTRDELQAAVRAAFPSSLEDPEVRRLLAMIATEPAAAGAGAPRLAPGADSDGSDPAQYQRASELLGLYVDVVATHEVISPSVLTDLELTRGLSHEERAMIGERSWSLVLRGEYRNQHGVRGLRLLQTLVRVIARDRGALIHDPDTLEIVTVDEFADRRLRASLGNVADQIPVVPFPDPANAGLLRLATRGMRRFGSVDLELSGVEPAPRDLTRATFLLHGLALEMVRLGEVDRSGIAVSAPDVIEVDIDDCAQAYATREAAMPRCADCPESVEVHLVEREAEPQDPPGHVVARVVAPRARSDAEAYSQPAWVLEALAQLFGAG
ncbi:MAG: hypothetical protein KC486_03780 [Myxococcales bacterium]|nr:hypothetical protein [Myxococcales bacterium]